MVQVVLEPVAGLGGQAAAEVMRGLVVLEEQAVQAAPEPVVGQEEGEAIARLTDAGLLEPVAGVELAATAPVAELAARAA